MDLNTAYDLATDLMDENGLHENGWTFEWSKTKISLGDCTYGTKTIRLSRYATAANTEAQMLDTILHEIAHALVGPGEGHGWKWKAMARKIGANPDRVAHGAAEIASKWKLACPSCDFYAPRHRRTNKVASCPKCSGGRYNEAFRLQLIASGDRVAA